MYKKHYTIEEIQTMKVYELPTVIYDAVRRDLEKLFGSILYRIAGIIDNATICQLDQYVNIYKYITVIA